MAGELISHYSVLRRLGAGGMGEVFLAQDTQLERPVALKVMSAELAKDLNQRKRFRTEAKAASGLTHPHICVIHEVGETADGRPFLAMEYVEGQALDQILAQRRLKIREVIKLGIHVAEALQAAHARGLVHRDIKPANLMLDSRGQVKVMDFGLAKWFAPNELSAASTSVAHTRTGMLIGTPQYMSPEQALGRTLDPRTDIFSLGVVLYELLAGQRPFLGKTVGETLNLIVNQPPAPLGLENPVFSPALDNIIFKCLQKEPDKRHASAEALAADLRKLKEDSDRALAATTQDRTLAPSASIPGETKKAGIRHAALGSMLGFVVLALLALGGWMLLRPGGSKSTAFGTQLSAPSLPKSVAVLPFVNMSADKADEYLSDGMTEELLNALAKLPGLRVPGRSSCFAFKGKNQEDIFRKVGEQLHVGAVLEGSVRKAGNRLRITAQLINVADGFRLWSDTYDRELTDILQIESEVAQQVAGALQLRLGMADTQALHKKPTENTDAYTLYLQGRYAWNRRTREGMNQAIVYFNQAIAKDPGYAKAYAGLADCYCILSDYDIYAAERQTFPQARAAALKALELDSTLAQARVALAFVKAYLDRDWAGSEVEFRRAIELNPNYATAHQWFGRLLLVLRRPQEALAEMNEAFKLDPLSPIVNSNLAEILARSGQTDLGIEVLQKQIARDPSFVATHMTLAIIYYYQGKWSEALAETETIRQLQGCNNCMLGGLAMGYAKLGRTDEARKLLGQMQENHRQGIDNRVYMAGVEHVLGDDTGALNSLEQAFEEHASGLESLNFELFWEDLRPHPRFQAILTKLHFLPAPTTNTPPAGSPKTVAVLPFANLSPDKADEYLSDGISEELINTLQKVTGLRVQGRGSSFYFKDRKESPQRIGEQLQVTYLLEGSVSKAGNQLRVAADLVSAADGFQLWSTNYDREIADILKTRSDIAQQVVAALNVQLGIGEAERIIKKPTDNPEAYALCLQGRFWSDQWTSEGFTNAVRLFQHAIELDPGYALAYAGLAQAYANVADWLLPPGAAMTAARTNAEKALSLDDSLAQPHIILGNAKDTYDWDHEGARQEFERALALAPNLAEAHGAYATYLRRANRFEEARRACKKAWQLDPLSPIRNDDLAILESCARNYPQALESSRTNALRFPGSILVHLRLAWVCEQVGQYEEALAEMAKARAMDDGPDLLSRHAHIYARAGQPGKALELQRDLQNWQKRAYVSPTYFAWVHLGLGQTNDAISRLQEAVDLRDGAFVNFNNDPYYDPIRADPRFIVLLRKAGLPQ